VNTTFEAPGNTLSRQQWREALHVATQHITFAILDDQSPADLVEALGGPRTPYATWRDVRGLLAVAWMQLNHDHPAAGPRNRATGDLLEVVMSAER
jgi:hypothetical protein